MKNYRINKALQKIFLLTNESESRKDSAQI